MELTTELLMKLLNDNRDTEYGKKYDFANIHAIGDKAVTRALDVLCELKGCEGTRTIAHNQLYTDGDTARIINDGGIFFQTTPQWTKNDDYTLRYRQSAQSVRPCLVSARRVY